MILMHILHAFGIALPLTCTSNGCIALTIDEGPSVYTEQLMDVLDKENVKATFHFNTSVRGSEFSEIYKKAIEDGHEIGMRTSPARTYTNDDDYGNVEEDLNRQLEFLESKIGQKIKFARSPLNGALPVDNVHRFFTKNNIVQTSYSFCPYDEEGTDPADSLKDFLSPTIYKQDTFIIQLYDQRLGEDDNLTELIKIIKENNYEFVTLSKCLDGYTPGKAIQNKGRSGKSLAFAQGLRVSDSFLPILLYFVI